MRKSLLISAVFVAGCNLPGLEFRHVAATRITIGSSIFDVRVKGDRAQAIRRNPEPKAQRKGLALRAIAAIETVSGCRAGRLDGDAALVVTRLDCGGATPRPPSETALICKVDVLYESFADLSCTPA